MSISQPWPTGYPKNSNYHHQKYLIFSKWIHKWFIVPDFCSTPPLVKQNTFCQVCIVIGEISANYVPKTMKNGAGVILTPQKVLALKEIPINSDQYFICKVKGDKCLEEYLDREIPALLIYRTPAYTRLPGSNWPHIFVWGLKGHFTISLKRVVQEIWPYSLDCDWLGGVRRHIITRTFRRLHWERRWHQTRDSGAVA